MGTWNHATKLLLKELNFENGLTMARRIVKPRDLRDRWEIPRFHMRDVFEADNSLRAENLRALFSSD